MARSGVLSSCIVIALCFSSVISNGDLTSDSSNDTKRQTRPIQEVVKERGYPLEICEVTTEDDYILTLHRIRHGKHSEQTNKFPVLLQHGLLDSSAAFVAGRTGMAYHLADSGYDVWINNSRGSRYSRSHKTKNPDTDKKYWDFSFHEMGMFDLPAVLKHIKDVTGSKQHYIGVSMGTTEFLVMGSERTDFLDYVDCVILLAPVARPQHMDLVETKFVQLMPPNVLDTLHQLGIREVLNHRDSVSSTVHKLCNSEGWAGRICEQTIRKMVPFDPENDLYDFESAKETFQYYPAGSTVKTLAHLFQIAKAGKFQQYDYYGENQNIYGSKTPPEYDLSKIKSTLHLIYGGQDNVAKVEDVEWLIERLPQPVVYDFRDYTHRDFLISKNLEDTLYKTIDKILEEHGARN